MDEEQAKLWAKNKENQKRVIAACVGGDPRTDKLAFFMAGIPGAGKTEFATYFMIIWMMRTNMQLNRY